MISENILSAVRAYLLTKDWFVKDIVEGKFQTLKREFDETIIVLPDESVLLSDGGQAMLKKALEWISEHYFTNTSEALYFLNNPESDLFSMRVIGDNIDHGKIDIESGGLFLFSYTSFIKKSIASYFKNKKITSEYIKYVSLLTPKPGSFIYQIELPILNDNQERLSLSNQSIGREINESIILKIKFLWLIKTTRNLFIEPEKSIQNAFKTHGITTSMLDNWIEMLSIDLSEFEFQFHMSILDSVSKNISHIHRLDFKKNDLEYFKELKIILEKSNDIHLESSPTIVEGNIWHIDEDKGKVKLQIYVDGEKYRVDYEVDREEYEKLKSLKARSKVFIDGVLSLHKKGRVKAELKEVHRIYINNSEGQLDLFIEQS